MPQQFVLPLSFPWLLIGLTAVFLFLVLFVCKTIKRRISERVYSRNILSNREKAMFSALQSAFPQMIVLAQVSFQALITTKSYRVRNQFQCKYADFVLCDQNLQVKCIIELDDRSHIGNEPKDAKRQALLENAGYKVIRFTHIPEPRSIQAQIKSML